MQFKRTVLVDSFWSTFFLCSEAPDAGSSNNARELCLSQTDSSGNHKDDPSKDSDEYDNE